MNRVYLLSFLSHFATSQFTIDVITISVLSHPDPEFPAAGLQQRQAKVYHKAPTKVNVYRFTRQGSFCHFKCTTTWLGILCSNNFPISLKNVYLLLWTFGPKLPGKHIRHTFPSQLPLQGGNWLFGPRKGFRFWFCRQLFLSFKNPLY